ncbi:MAG: hypothetical protein HRU21_09205 [Pseudomonadales bacterium]|nr:hypothetical protein [Pseudomonadales bacterium]
MAQNQQRKTMSFDELEEVLSDGPSLGTHGKALMAHLRQQDLRLTAWEENLKKLNQRFTSLDEEFFEHVEKTPHGETLLDCPPHVSGQSNPVQFTPEYKKAQGYSPGAPVTATNIPDYLKQEEGELQFLEISFDDPRRQKAFDTALGALQFLDKDITKHELISFLMSS